MVHNGNRIKNSPKKCRLTFCPKCKKQGYLSIIIITYDLGNDSDLQERKENKNESSIQDFRNF